MENYDSREVTMSTGDVVNDSDATVEIKIKTLDSQTYTLRVNKCVPVPALKEQIASVTGVVSEQQRLICRGRVLRDDQLLSAYHVEDGHTLHLVVRQPLTASSSPSTSFMGSESAFGHPATNSATNNDRGRGANIVFEAVNIDQGDHTNPGLHQILASILSSLVSLNGGSENARTDHREMNLQRQDRASADTGVSDAARSQSSPATSTVEFDPQQAGFPFPTAAHLGSQQPTVIPDSLTTMNQYLGLMRSEFEREDLRANGNVHNDNVGASGDHLDEPQNQDFQSRSASGQAGLPNPSALAEIMLATRELLVQMAGGSLSQLARQLENQASIADPTMRTNIQSSAMRIGVLLQNLGPLLLELGRTTMTLRMGQTPSEAVVNAGPAIFISSSGPNPMMVQPGPFFPGPNFGRVHMGSVSSGRGLEGQPLASTFIPRSIEIQIHTGRTVPVATGNQDEQAANQQGQGQADPARTSAGASFVRPVFSGLSGHAPSPGESGLRVVPMRTVVTVPAGVGPSPSDSSGSGIGLFYPLIARIQQLNSGNVNNARGSQPSTGSQPGGPEAHEQSRESNNGGAVRYDNHSPTNTTTAASGTGSSANESAQYQGSAHVCIRGQQRPTSNNDNITQAQNGQHIGQGSRAHMLDRIDQIIRTIMMGEEIRMSGSGQQNSGVGSATDHASTTTDAQLQETSEVGEQAIFFSNLVRQLMPYLSQGRASEQVISMDNPSSSMAQTERENQTDSRSSKHQHDPLPDAQSSKRQKRE